MLHHGVAEGLTHDPGPFQFRQVNGLGLADFRPETNPAFYAFFLIDPGLFLLGVLFIFKKMDRFHRTIIHAELAPQAFFLIDSHDILL
jgi:hypothetical protein